MGHDTSERYENIASFIDVQGVETSENALGQAVNAQRGRLELATTKVSQSTNELTRLFTEHRLPEEQADGFEAWAKQNAEADISNLRQVVSALAVAMQIYQKAVEAMEDANVQQARWKTKHAESEAAKATFDKAVKAAPDAVDQLLNLLESGKTYAQSVGEVKTCPICSNPTSRKQMLETIENTQAGFQILRTAKQQKDQAQRDLGRQKETAQDSYLRFLQAIQQLSEAVTSLPEGVEARFVQFGTDYPLLAALPKAITKAHCKKEPLEQARKLMAQLAETSLKWKQEYDHREPQKTLISSIQVHYRALQEGRVEVKAAESVLSHLQKMLDTIRSIRQKFVQDTLASVSAECDRLYQQIHPEEPLGGIQLMLDTNKRASCNISADFCGKEDVPPQAYYSESHMDTLGFALFLALAKCEGGHTIVVLDDVFTSVDEQHLERICQLIAEEATSFAQTIMTTHIRKILDWVQTGKLPQAKFGVMRLGRWGITDGIRAKMEKTNREELEELLKDPFLDRTQCAAKTRRHLEALLGNLVLSLGGTGRMKRFGDYELADYLGGLQSLAKEGWQVVRTDAAVAAPTAIRRVLSLNEPYLLREKAKDLNDDKNVVNKLIHDSEEGSHFTDDETREYMKEVLSLDSYLRCDKPGCGSLVGANKRFNSCACGAKKMEKRPA